MRRFFSHLIAGIILSNLISCARNSDTTVKTDSTATAKYEFKILQKKVYLINDSLFKKVRICTEMFPPLPPEMNQKQAIDTNVFLRSDGFQDTIILPRFPERPSRIVALKPYVWHRDTLRVMFLDGDSEVVRKVKLTAKIWENYCGIRFLFGKFDNPDITISFLHQGSWSYIGSYSPKMRPSMNFGWLDGNTDDAEYHRVVLHEFGHALGFIHEHQSPDANIPWNKTLVYQYYAGSPNYWDNSAVDENIFRKYSHEETQGTSFDKSSIMLYAIPASLTDGIFHTDENDNLSGKDTQYVAKLYPKKL